VNLTIRKIGNSDGVILPKDILERLGVKAGDELQVQINADGLTLTVPNEQFTRQLAHAERFMDRYKIALKKLAE
jgi:putative addiction module antidote